MIGWKVLYEYQGKEVICEVVGQAVTDEVGFGIPLYYNNHIMMAWFNNDQIVKVIERK